MHKKSKYVNIGVKLFQAVLQRDKQVKPHQAEIISEINNIIARNHAKGQKGYVLEDLMDFLRIKYDIELKMSQQQFDNLLKVATKLDPPKKTH